jgi:hypothetical protein
MLLSFSRDSVMEMVSLNWRRELFIGEATGKKMIRVVVPIGSWLDMI